MDNIIGNIDTEHDMIHQGMTGIEVGVRVRTDFKRKDPSYKIDMYGYCCKLEVLNVAADYAYNYTTPKC